jgi:hypothetical protein
MRAWWSVARVANPLAGLSGRGGISQPGTEATVTVLLRCPALPGLAGVGGSLGGKRPRQG